MKSIKCMFICLIFSLIVAICEAEIIRELFPLSSNIIKANSKEGSSDKMNSSAYNYGRTRAVHAQRPNVAPIRPRHPTRSSDSSKSPAPATTSWREPKPSQPQRELIFTSPQRNMREKSGTAKDHSKKRHSRKRHHKNNSKRTQGLRNRRPNVFPMRPHFTTEKPTAVFRRRNPAFARSSQREHTFISVPRHIRYLGGTSTTYVALGLYFARGESTIANIVAETTKKIWETLMNTYMAVPDTNKWKQIAERYYTLWNMPNCLGSLDGKHFKIKKYPNTGSANFNYKNYNSVMLMACADADGLFTMIEVGYAGRNSDAGIFRVSDMKRLIESDALNIPAPARLPLDENNYSFPFYFVGDEAFPLEKYLMRPFPGRTATNTSRVFNYRLSRARKSVECTFGMLTEKFMLFESPIRCRTPEVVNNIIKSACVLHNFVRSKEGMSYQATNISGGTSQRPNGIIPHDLILGPNPSSLALRKYLNNYFLAPQTALPWQWAYCI